MLFHERVQLSHGETPLHDAARSNTVDAIKFLVENGVKVDVTDHYGRTPLHVAAETNANAVAQLLLKKGAFLETRDHNGSSPLQVAVQNNSIDVINVLLQNGADLTVKNPYGYGLLHLAAALGYQRVVELLIDKAIILLQEKYFKDKYGCTPLHMAKRRGFHNIAKLFIPYLSPIENQVIQFNKVTTAENLYTLILNGQFSSYIEWARKSHKDEMVAKALTLTPLLSKSSTVKLPTGEYLGWTQGIAELHQLGLTGKNVLIGLIDFDLDDELGHGPTVENIIQAIAPGVRIVRREVVRDSPPSPNSISINTHTIHFKWSSRLKSMIDQVIICYPYDQNHPAWNDKKIPQKIVVKAGEEIFLYHGNIKNLIKINNTFCYIDIFKNDFTKWELLEKVPITSDNKAGKVIFELMRQGVTIINYSKGIDGLLWTQDTFKQFNDLGGILVKSAGNHPYTPGQTAAVTHTISAIDLIHEQWIEKAKYVIIVGALEKNSEGKVFHAPYSTKAGIWKNKYIATVVDLRKHCQIETGTSFAAPQVTGVLALLKEAFPNCSPQILAQMLLETAQPIENSREEETGRGEMNPVKAYKKLQQESAKLCQTSPSP